MQLFCSVWEAENHRLIVYEWHSFQERPRIVSESLNVQYGLPELAVAIGSRIFLAELASVSDCCLVLHTDQKKSLQNAKSKSHSTVGATPKINNMTDYRGNLK